MSDTVVEADECGGFNPLNRGVSWVQREIMFASVLGTGSE
jgi:hypothetical protein